MFKIILLLQLHKLMNRRQRKNKYMKVGLRIGETHRDIL